MVPVDSVLDYDHVTFWVGNAKQAAFYYCFCLGFEHYAYKGIESGSRDVAAHVVKQDKVFFIFVSAYKAENKELGEHIATHGDSVKDIAFNVHNLDDIVQNLKEKGSKIVKDIWTESDENGSVRFATVRVFDDVTHTFIERNNYNGLFLPGYNRVDFDDHYGNKLNLKCIDHIVLSVPSGQLAPLTDWYESGLQFQRFFSVDDKQIATKYSSLKSTVMVNQYDTVKMTIAEPATGLKRSQIEEYLEYNGGCGVQHIALITDDIIETVSNMKERGVEFLKVAETYYDQLNERLKNCPVEIIEDINKLKQFGILIDYDEKGYLLQIFTTHLQDRPTLFVEILQRHNFNGFGVGNFKALFEAIETVQAVRGNL